MIGLLGAAGLVALLTSVTIVCGLEWLIGEFVRTHFKPLFGATFFLVFFGLLRWFWRYRYDEWEKPK